ncbi:RnfH family protein [Orrella daihaiensis]|uniref:UPF0125 protein DHf2319_07580 n=1 Tax=Orrella daihaiensis TaxID=2782176 RepID=A0ABY4AIY3_9BURK|nr:RnfH family protein [Orrella daihaiensis]UOD49355.1 RnfH family protein [Orrella daihaiensis]
MATVPEPANTQRQIWVVYALGRNRVWQRAIQPLPGMSIAQAIDSSGFEAQHPDVDWRSGGVGIFGRRVKPEDMVNPGDRIEIYRALVFDPKESRRRRALHRQRQTIKGKTRGRQRIV